MTTYMFPGQGAQSIGMGKDLFDAYSNIISQANDILSYDVRQLCEEDPQKLLNNTQYTQPALFTVQAMYYLNKKQQGSEAEYFIGHSLGEYSALFAAGVFDFATGLTIIKKRGELMAQANNGAMLAVLGFSLDQLMFILKKHQLYSIDVANINAEKQIVLSGLVDEIKQIESILSASAGQCIPLKASGAFHSRHMYDIAQDFKYFLAKFTFEQPQYKVLANANAKLYHFDNIVDNLVEQMHKPVRWHETIKYLKNNGESNFIELGPNSVLSHLVTQN